MPAEAQEYTTRVTVTTATTTVLAARTAPARLMGSFYNEGPNVVYLSLDGAASTTNYVAQLALGELYELPQPPHQGIISAVTSTGTAFLQVVEEV